MAYTFPISLQRIYMIRLIRHVVSTHPLSSCINNKRLRSYEYQYSAMNILLDDRGRKVDCTSLQV